MRTPTMRRVTVKTFCLLAFLLLASGGPLADAPKPAARYEPIAWANEVSGKNFPLFAILDADATAHRALASDGALRALLDARRQALTNAATTCADKAPCHVETFRWNGDDIGRVREALVKAAKSGSLKMAIDRMRRSGLFARDAALDDEAFVARSWDRAAAGLNYILGVYGLGEKPRYAAIDAISHDPASPEFGRLVHTAVGLMDEQASGWNLFFQPSLALALRLLEINYRDEAARHEPMHLRENAAAFKRIPTIAWANYPYTATLVPGAGLSDQMERENHGLSPMGRQIIEIAARRYHAHKVPLIIVSGGYVHPKHSRFAEAIEMKTVLVRDFHVPEDAILVDPHARHTTTNVRNAARLMFRYGIPTDRGALITTQQYHLDSIASPAFDERNERELGYRPYLSMKRLSRFEVEWVPNVLSLHADPLDPLDP
jgi:hypothetical protein